MEKEKFELEFLIKASSNIIYNFISTPSGLAGWFSDDVHIRGNVYTFIWEGSEEKAELVTKKKGESVKFRWEDNDEDDKSYFEIRIKIDPLTSEVALIVTDFAEPDDKEDAILLWESQIDALKNKLGA